MKIVLVVAHYSIFDETINQLVEKHPGMPWHRKRGQNWAKIGDTKYQLVSSPDHMRGYHGVEVDFWGPLPSPEKQQQWEEQAMVARME